MANQSGAYNLIWLSTLSHVVTVAGASLAGILAWNYVAYFTADAKIDLGLHYVNVSYDDAQIARDFKRFQVNIPWDNIPSRGAILSVIDSCGDFRERSNVEIPLSIDGLHREIDSELRDAVIFEFRERAGSKRVLKPGFVSNRAYWEHTFPEALDALGDTLLFHQAMRVVLAQRIVTAELMIANTGDVPARDVVLHFRHPWFLDSRFVMNQAVPQFVKFEPDRPDCMISNSGSHATLSIPYLRPGDDVLVSIATTMTNVTLDNISEYHSSDPRPRPMSVLAWWVVVTFVLLVIPMGPRIGTLIGHIFSRKQS